MMSKQNLLPALILAALYMTIGLAPPAAAIDQDAAFSDEKATADSVFVDTSIAIPTMENEASTIAKTGSISLSWRSRYMGSNTSAHMFEIQEARDSLFDRQEVYYRGPDLATYVSGLASGHYYFRVREWVDSSTVSGWSNPVEVVVEHHSLGFAWLLFAIGGIVFLLTAGVVVHGAREQDGEDESPDEAQEG